MSEKDKFAEKLKTKGYDAANVDGVIMIRMSADEYNSGAPSRLRTVLKEAGCTCSWGITTKRSRKAEPEPSEQEESKTYIEKEEPIDTIDDLGEPSQMSFEDMLA